MRTGFTLAGLVLGAFIGFKRGFRGWVLAGFIGLTIEIILGINLIGMASASGYSWAAAIGGFLLGNAVGSLSKFFFKN
jgi:hypothetical protein